jgi:ubiquinone/menaquinone biosynthesis C-methylase UbiE
MEKLHSEAYFGDQRDFWWHRDFIELMAKRWELNKVTTILDVGCGQGHWGLTLLPVLPPNCKLIGIDSEPKWVEVAKNKSKQYGFDKRTDYQMAKAELLPFDDNSFDMVTCQTVLIHVDDPIKALKEMKRVLKPNGLLVAVEPNNAVGSIIQNNLTIKKPVVEVAELIKFQLICEKGKETLGEGNNMRGDLLPYFFSQVKLTEINSYLSDMADFYIPPYSSPREKAGVANDIKWIEKGFFVWDKFDTHRYYVTGGGDEESFTQNWLQAMQYNQERLKAYHENNLFCPGGMIFYLTSGRKI